MKKLANPFVAAALGLVLGVGSGLFTFWRAAESIVAHLALQAPAKKEVSPEVRERGWNFWTIEIENLATELKEERERQKKQGEQLDRREAQLAAETQELNKVRTEIEGLRQEIATKVVEINADEVKNIRSLAATYTALPARAAVAIMREMDDAIVVKILSVMKPEAVMPIFEEMSHAAGTDTSQARRAAQLSDRLRLLKSTKTASSP